MLESLRSLCPLLSRKKAGREAVAGVGEVTVTTGAALAARGSGDTNTRGGRSCRRVGWPKEEGEGADGGDVDGGAGPERGALEKEKNGSPEVE